jgi:hypothetical protein
MRVSLRASVTTSSALCGVLIFAVSASAQAGSNQPQAGGGQPTGFPSIVVKYIDQASISDYAATIDVFEAPNDVAMGPNGHRTFCFLPQPIVSQTLLDTAFHQLDASLTDAQKKSNAVFTIPVQWTYDLARVKQLVATYLESRYGGTIQPQDIQTLPLNAFVVYALFPDGTQLTLRHFPDIDTGGTQMIVNSLPEPGTGQISATYAQLKSFDTNPQIGAHGYVTAAALATTAISISGQIFTSNDFLNQVNGAGGLSQILNSQSSTGGVGLAIPVLSGIFGGGESSSSSSETSSINRFVSRHFVQSALENGSSSVVINSFSDANPDQQKSTIISQLVNFALGAMNHTTAQFVSDASGLYKLHSDSLNADLGTGMTLSQIAAASKGSSNFDPQLSQDISDGKVTAKDTEQLTQNSTSDISWTASGSIMVPSTVDLYYSTDEHFTQTITDQFVGNEAHYTNAVYDAPANNLTTSVRTSFDVGIGSIVASMVPWENQSPEFREHFVPADGRAVDSTTQYFALMNSLRPAGEPVLTAVAVPDLRGIFLRGLNNFDTALAPSTMDPDYVGKTRVAGQDQEQDSMRREVDTIANAGGDLNNFVRRTGGDAGNGDHFSPLDAVGHSSGHALQVTVGQGSETRPVNRAVYYYIRVN